MGFWLWIYNEQEKRQIRCKPAVQESRWFLSRDQQKVLLFVRSVVWESWVCVHLPTSGRWKSSQNNWEEQERMTEWMRFPKSLNPQTSAQTNRTSHMHHWRLVSADISIEVQVWQSTTLAQPLLNKWIFRAAYFWESFWSFLSTPLYPEQSDDWVLAAWPCHGLDSPADFKQSSTNRDAVNNNLMDFYLLCLTDFQIKWTEKINKLVWIQLPPMT